MAISSTFVPWDTRIEHAGDRPMFVGAVQDVTESRLAETRCVKAKRF